MARHLCPVTRSLVAPACWTRFRHAAGGRCARAGSAG
jgi:hypothetical protein